MASVNDLTINQILDIKQRVEAGEYQHIVASDYHINQGRVNEIAKGKRFLMITSPHLFTRRVPDSIPKGLPMFR